MRQSTPNSPWPAYVRGKGSCRCNVSLSKAILHQGATRRGPAPLIPPPPRNQPAALIRECDANIYRAAIFSLSYVNTKSCFACGLWHPKQPFRSAVVLTVLSARKT